MEIEVKALLCPKCNIEKSRDAFGRRSGGKTYKHKRWCKECCAASVRRTYASSLKYRQSHKSTQRRRCLENHRRIYQYLKEHPCIDCGEADPVVLQFDHRPGTKTHCVTGLTTRGWPAIQEEIAKCDVTCANCHARRTAKRANTIRWQLSTENV